MKLEQDGILVGTLPGGVSVRRTEGPGPQPWITEYELAGNRVSGRVQIVPYYDEPVVERNWSPNGAPTERAWEFLPSAFSITYGGKPAWHGDGRGTLVVNGVVLDGGLIWRTPTSSNDSFRVCRPNQYGGIEEAPVGARDKTRALVRDLVELHRQDSLFVREKAVEYAKFRRSRRLVDLDKEHRAVSALLRELMGRNAELVKRHALMSDDARFAAALLGVSSR
ncbi:hypothetical protein ACFYXL_18375 [Streptomyces tsukubensis]|uniref:hypothetical protein n=1 Tax=Streptomyces tsukubensis TaxID=83656 RepID=UPI0036D0BAFF